jgi:hypothetical protein
MKKLSLWQPRAIAKYEDEIIEGEIVEERSNNKIVRSGGRANFRADIAEAAKQIDARTGQIKTPMDDYFPDPFLLRMDKEREEFEAKHQPHRQVKGGFFARLPKPYTATVLLPSGEKVEVNSKEEETAIIRKYWR